MATSYQLPDLLAIGRAFELRANPNCSRVLKASESWIRGLGVLTSDEEKQVSQTKAGLLVSLCFPTCDVPQLRLMMDLSTLMMLGEARVRAGRNPWDGSTAGSVGGEGDWQEVLQSNTLLRHIIPSLKRLITKTTPSWQARFTDSVRKFRDSELLLSQSTVNTSTSPYPDVESFIELRRAASGIEIIFDMIEPLHDLAYPELDGSSTRRREESVALLRKLRQCAGDIVAWTGDIAAHNHNQSLAHSPPTLVFLLMSTQGISLQAAIDEAASLSRQALSVFIETERMLKAGPVPTPPTPSPFKRKHKPTGSLARLSGSWNWLFSSDTSSSSTATAPGPSPLSNRRTSDSDAPRSRSSLMLERRFDEHASWWDTTEEEEDVRIYVESLKDCIVGSVNWLYENEVYFGDKADEVKQYGWVFLKPKERETSQ